MVLAPDPVFKMRGAVAASEAGGLPRPLVLLTPSGRRFDQQVAEELAATGGFSLLCGRYEGVDQRVADHLVDEELSVGDFVLAGGELAALVVVEAVVRLLPGVLGNGHLGGGGELLGRPPRVSPVHPPGRVPGVGGSRRASLRRPRAGGAGGAPRPWSGPCERRPDLIAGRGGLTDEEVRLLVEHGEVHLLREQGYNGEPRRRRPLPATSGIPNRRALRRIGPAGA